jgi:putative aldouronate transport system permease protein
VEAIAKVRKNSFFTRKSAFDIGFELAIYIVLTLVAGSILYSLILILSASFSQPEAVYQGRVWLLPQGFTLEGYQRVFKDSSIWIGYRNSLYYTVLGTFISISLTITSAYALSRKDLVGRGPITALMVFTMFFNGGIIPTYLIVKELGMLDKVWAMVLPTAVSMTNVIITRTFFAQTIPQELLEAAQIDGCGNTRFFFFIALPLSQAIVAVISLFYSVALWNDYFTALLYMDSQKMYPLQLILRQILLQSQMTGMVTDLVEADKLARIAEIIKYALIIVASVPLLILYPFLQRYFVKGIMIGSIKG